MRKCLKPMPVGPTGDAAAAALAMMWQAVLQQSEHVQWLVIASIAYNAVGAGKGVGSLCHGSGL
jgi:hypothetical protein